MQGATPTATVRAARRANLPALFAPKSIAIVGASDRSFYARNALHRLDACGYAGEVHLVNPRADAVAGRRCHTGMLGIGKPIDLAFIAVPRAAVVPALEEATAAGARAAVIVTTGFGESADAEGRRLQSALDAWLATSSLAVCGPSCLGVINVHGRAQAFGGHPGTDILPGSVALVSQSGANVHTYIGAALARNFGFSCIVSSGNEAGLDTGDYIDYFIDDPATRVICAYVESFRHPEALPAIARRAQVAGKPIVLIKIGRSQSSARAALAHTGSMTGPDAYFAALFAQFGIVRANSIEEALDRATIFASSPLKWWLGTAGGGRTGIVSVSGGFAGAFSDMTSDPTSEGAAVARISVPELDAATVARIEQILPPHVGPQNPLDLSTQVRRDRPDAWRDTLDAVAGDAAVDVVLAAEATPMDEARLRSLVSLRECHGKPVLLATTSPHIGIMDDALLAICRDAGLPLLAGAEGTHRAMESALAWMTASKSARAAAADTSAAPSMKSREPLPRPATRVLHEVVARDMLLPYGITGPASRLVSDPDAALAAAKALGGSVALKIVSSAITHRSDLGLVALDVAPGAVKDRAADLLQRASAAVAPGELATLGVLVQAMTRGAAELFIGVTAMAGHAPLLVVGMGGIYVELLGDRATRICPVDEDEALRMLRSLRLFPMLDGYRGCPRADVPAAARAIAAVSAFAMAAAGWLAEAEINPLIVMPEGGGVFAVDALVVAREA